MRVALVGHSYPPYLGGLSHVLYNLSVELKRLGHEVLVVTLRVHPGLPAEEVVDGVKVVRVPGVAPSNAYYAPSPQIVKAVRAARPDVVHVHNVGALTVPVVVLTHRLVGLGGRLVITPHHHEGGSTAHTRAAWAIYKPIAAEALRAADVVHSVSPFEAKLVERDFGVRPVVIPNGVKEDVLRFAWSPPEEPVVTYAGRVEGYKRVHTLARAVGVVRESLGVNVALRVVGSGPYLPRVVRVCRELGVPLEHYPFLPRTHYLRALATSTVFANISMYEAFSIVAAEALAIGVPAVLSKPWGYTFLGYGARVVDGGRVVDVAEALAEAIEYRDVSIRGRRRGVRMLTWGEVASRVEKMLYLGVAGA